jgi:hypothetical protein
VRVVLLACIIVISFEAWSGNIRLAVTHLFNAHRLVYDRITEALESRTTLYGSPSLGTANLVESDLFRAFLGLDIIIACQPSSPTQVDVFEREGMDALSRMPEVFSTLQEAEIYRNALKLQTRRFISRYAPSSLNPIPCTFSFVEWWGPWEEAPSHIAATEKDISAAIIRWRVAFKPLWKLFKSKRQVYHRTAVLLNLDIRLITLELLIAGIGNENLFDNYADLFHDITDFSEDILESNKSDKGHYSLEHQVVIPLAYTAVKCRHRVIRRKAISLMFKHPRREGLSDSVFFGHLGEWGKTLEEAFLVDGQVPGWARIGDFHGKRDGENSHKITFTCLQKISEASGEVVIRTKVLDERYDMGS